MFSPFHYVFGALFEHKTGIICFALSLYKRRSDWLPLALIGDTLLFYPSLATTLGYVRAYRVSLTDAVSRQNHVGRYSIKRVSPHHGRMGLVLRTGTTIFILLAGYPVTDGRDLRLFIKHYTFYCSWTTSYGHSAWRTDCFTTVVAWDLTVADNISSLALEPCPF